MNRIQSTIFLLSILLTFSLPVKAQNNNGLEVVPIGPEAFQVMRGFFEYDKNILLEPQIVERINNPEYVREKFTLSGTRNNRTPGYLAIPKEGRPPYPCILQIHGLTSSKESWWEEEGTMGQLTRQLLAAGFAVLSLDAEYHGERLANQDPQFPITLLEAGHFIQFRDMMLQSVIDYRRALDYLATRAEIDTSMVGIIGYSMGGVMAFNLSATDPRIKAAVACVSPIVPIPHLPTAVHNSAPYIDHPFLMLMAENDDRNYSVSAAKDLHKLISSPAKELVFYNSGHMLPHEWTNRATAWMEKYLK